MDLVIYPWSDDRENISKKEENDESYGYIYSPFFEISLCFYIIATCPCPCDTQSYDTEDTEEHHDKYKPPDNLCKHCLKTSKSRLYNTLIFSFLHSTITSSFSFSRKNSSYSVSWYIIFCSISYTGTFRSWNLLCYYNCFFAKILISGCICHCILSGFSCYFSIRNIHFKSNTKDEYKNDNNFLHIFRV